MDANIARALPPLSHSDLTTGQALQQYDHSQDVSTGNKRKSEDGQQGMSKAKRSRYISLACNECKRRKIKCNGQTPCQRCGNLSLECVYAPNCCNGFRDTEEYRQMADHMSFLQQQVGILHNSLNEMRAAMGLPLLPGPQMDVQQQDSAQRPGEQGAPIDPSLHGVEGYDHRAQYPGSQPPPAPMSYGGSPSLNRNRTMSQTAPLQPAFRGPTSTEFNFEVAKHSLQTMGIHSLTEQGQNGSADVSSGASPLRDPADEEMRMQLIKQVHETKDPIWTIPKPEALRLCEVYEDEMGLMYPILDMTSIKAYVERLYAFMDAMRRSGVMQQGMPGADALDDENTNVLKLIIACAMTLEGSGRSEKGEKMFAHVQSSLDYALSGRTDVKSIQLLTITAIYEFHRDNEDASWRIIGMAARACIERGLHRRETYDSMVDDASRSEALLLFWSVYVLDRRWSFGTGKPFALQDIDIDRQVPRPEARSPYLSAMVRYCEIGGEVWNNTSNATGGTGAIDKDKMNYLDYQINQWQRTLPASLQYTAPTQSGQPQSPELPASRAAHRLQIVLYLRANQMRTHIYRPVLHSATSIISHRAQAQTVVDIAKDTIRVLTHTNQTSDLYRTQQILFNAFLTSALAVLFLAVSHTPAIFADDVRQEFFSALELVRAFSKDSFVSKKLWRTLRGLKEVGPKLGLLAIDSKHGSEPDPSRSAAVAMAGLRAGLNGQEDVYAETVGHAQPWPEGNSSSPENMANDFASLFEAAGSLASIGQGQSRASAVTRAGYESGVPEGGAEDLSGVLRELF
ncbi:hypothetical protein B0A48_08025 [Cryoendolithus antarcticus]|uniref:Zn(2)-C6 fungal-type domain-containing protein n=1 Tax=Cryoendolithus antarcticus TaxID=1507870 RepID=A0A1V8T0S8_9PEZI|nr:hypothetical protein B0A48_08025 [Cryoendolithus antarcticus]